MATFRANDKNRGLIICSVAMAIILKIMFFVHRRLVICNYFNVAIKWCWWLATVPCLVTSQPPFKIFLAAPVFATFTHWSGTWAENDFWRGGWHVCPPDPGPCNATTRVCKYSDNDDHEIAYFHVHWRTGKLFSVYRTKNHELKRWRRVRKKESK